MTAAFNFAAASTGESSCGPASGASSGASAPGSLSAAAAAVIRAVGIARERCGDVAGALTWYRRALLEDSHHGPSLLALGAALLRVG
eukprot:CAMPEP_0197579390 /NCGR_PEP_ID=MMETSP1326-20131121/3404_1 /TAXON_ID=1155430 /ORGANISM="Genus nov. species nov., Strain RCC2288" /LENGTH=86 /DNA_ID=CAMNT_0043142837 /DNA_START=333 /DNA_END=590 /DNA_ORIENTATION=+